MRALVFAVLLAGASTAAPAVAQDDADLAVLQARLADQEAARAVKRLHHAWSQYALEGDWQSMYAMLGDATFLFGSADPDVRAAMDATLVRLFSRSPPLAPDELNVRLPLSPVVNVAADGRTAWTRWREVAMTGHFGESAVWSGGTYENYYALDDGVWKIRQLSYFPQYYGTYEDGWRNASETVPLIDYHYTPDEAGQPTTRTPAPRDAALDEAEWGDDDDEDEREVAEAPTPLSLAEIAARTDALLAEDAIASLQAAYGYYMDRRMWDDVVDLFAEDGTLAICPFDAAHGATGIRARLDHFGALGLERGDMFDHMQLAPVVTVAADGQSAQLRGLELAWTGEHGGPAIWSVNVIEAAFEKDGDVWKISAMRSIPRMTMDYAEGWAASAPGDGASSEDCPAPYPNREPLPITFPHPVTGDRPAPIVLDDAPAPADVARKLDRLDAYLGAENVSNAYGYYIDEFRWGDTADVFSEDGWKELSYIGTFIGRERVRESLFSRYGDGGRTGPFMTLHQTTQPVVTVAEDGQSARIRERLFQMNSSSASEGSYMSGTYENQIVLEDGIWRIAGMDLDYIWQAGYAAGWAGIDPDAPKFSVSEEAIAAYPPDSGLRGVVNPPFPEIAPMAFHYVNPVSGRAPDVLLEWSDGRRE